SEGTLGIVTAATLRLVPQTQGRVVAWAGCGSIHAARALLLLAEERLGEALEGFEVLPQTCLDAVLAYLPDARAPLEEPQAWHALIEVVGDPARLRGALEDLLGEALAAGTIADATIAASEAQAEALWTLRESISPAERAKGPAAQHDVAVPVESMPAFIEEARVRIEADWPGTRAFGFGHLGDGNIHFHVAAPPGVDAASWDAGDGKAISRMVHDLVTAAQGTISAEHGIGQMKLGELERLADPVALSLMRQVKAVLDPRGLLNPGKLVSLAPRPPTP
ncbi:MAG TPA: FAD-linked oxidase C-terminal domain-containing protein, partial [Novosphingobium sp.]|nr:FAD-linked oxidase C-terminal domain-containing protein [Novosphingobium sp.]